MTRCRCELMRKTESHDFGPSAWLINEPWGVPQAAGIKSRRPVQAVAKRGLNVDSS